jgi:hypothetical protein
MGYNANARRAPGVQAFCLRCRRPTGDQTMRKFITMSAVAAATLSLAACGKTETVNASDTNFTEMNTAEAIEGSTNDSMTPVDGAAGVSTNMTTGNMASNVMGNTTATTTEKAAGNTAVAASNGTTTENGAAKAK